MNASILHDRPMPMDAFPEIAPLIAAAKADGIDARAVLARVLTDLFIRRELHTGDELAQFSSLVEPLVRAIDLAAAVIVGRKLAAHAETPRRVIEALLTRDDEASDATLRGAVMLDLRTLDILAERGSGFVAAAIAARDVLAASTARILVARDEVQTDLALARRREASLPGDVVSLLAGRARGNPDLAQPILAVAGLPFAERSALFLEAEPQQRAAMAAEATRRAYLARTRPSPFIRNGIDDAVVALAGKGDARLAEALSSWLGLPTSEAAAMVTDSTGEALVLGLRACGARPPPIMELMLKRGLHLSRSVERIFALDRLARDTSGAGAAMILQSFAQAKPRPQRHMPAQAPAREAERAERAQSWPRGELQIGGPARRRERTR